MPALSDMARRMASPTARAWDVGDRAFAQMAEGRDVIHLGVGDPDFDTSPETVAAVQDALARGRTHYAPIPGEPALRQAIAGHVNSRYGSDVSADQIVVTPGAQSALFSVFLLLAGAGDEVIVLEPYYTTYPAVATAGGARMVSVPLDQTNGYALDVGRVAAAITPRARAILINTPGNPTGAQFDEAAIEALVALCEMHDIWLVSDEVYATLTYDAPHRSPFAHPAARDRTIIVESLSKSHAMTGWRIGWVVAPKPFATALTDLAQAQQFGVTQFVQDAACVALADTETPQRMRTAFKARRDALCAGLAGSQALRFAPPAGGMFVLANCAATGLDGEAFAEALLDEQAVAVVPGFGFGPSAQDTVRIGFLTDEARLTEAAARITAFANAKMEART